MSAREDGLERLLSAVFEGNEPAPELLAAYARNPGLLSPETLREIERALVERPDLADEVRTLRSFELPSLAEPAVRRAPRRRWGRVAVWAGAAAAALLVFASTPQGRRWLESLDGVPPAGVVAPSPSEQQAALPAAPPAPEAPAPAPIEPPRVVASTPPPAPTEPAPEQRAEAPLPVEPSPSAPEEPAEPQVAVQDPVPLPGEPPAPDETAPGPVAMLEPSYRRPDEAGLDRRRLVVAMRGPAPEAVELSALAPEHVAFTRSAAPDLFWKLSGPPPEGAKILFRLVDERSGDTVLETQQALPAGSDVQRVRLAEQAATLAPGAVYTWYIVLRADPENPARDQLAQGWIQLREIAIAPTGEPGALPAELARSGLWYDALAAALDLLAQQPDNPSVQRGVRALLAQGGVAVDLD